MLLRPAGYGHRGQAYDVVATGSSVATSVVIVSGSTDPEHDACRALLARGITGTMQTVDDAGNVRMRLNIEKAAKLTVVDEDTRGLRVRAWKAFPAGGSKVGGENGARRHQGSGRPETAPCENVGAAP